MEEPTQTPATGSEPREPGRGTTILVLGILSLVICAPLGPFAWIMGKGDLKKMDEGIMDNADRSNTKAGMICGIIGTVLMILAFLWFVVVGASVGAATAAGG